MQDEALLEAIDFYKQGKPVAEILAMFPEHTEELEEIFEILEEIKKEKSELLPSESLVKAIFSSISKQNLPEVPEAATLGVPVAKKPGFFKKLFNLFNNKLRIFVPVVVVLGIAVFIFVNYFGWAQNREIDSLLYTLEQESAQETILAEEGDNDIALISQDTETINSFEEIYNENEF